MSLPSPGSVDLSPNPARGGPIRPDVAKVTALESCQPRVQEGTAQEEALG